MKVQPLMMIGIFVLVSVRVNAQTIGPSVLNASGGGAVIGTGTYEWSVGEIPMVSTLSAPGIVITQGLLQPAPSASAIKTLVIGDQELQVFPVPVSTLLNIRPYFNKGGVLTCLLLDEAGKTVADYGVSLVSGNEPQQMNIGPFAAGNYLLCVRYESAGVCTRQTYKIQKIN